MHKNKPIQFLSTSVNIAFIVWVLLFLFDLFNVLEIKGETIKSYIYLGLPFCLPFVLIFNGIVVKSRNWFITTCTLFVLMIGSFSFVVYKQGLLNYLLTSGSWYTQEIIFEHKKNKSERIEFQMKDIGARGYERRYIHVIYVTNWLMFTQELPKNENYDEDWIKVNKSVNELGIVY